MIGANKECSKNAFTV